MTNRFAITISAKICLYSLCISPNNSHIKQLLCINQTISYNLTLCSFTSNIKEIQVKFRNGITIMTYKIAMLLKSPILNYCKKHLVSSPVPIKLDFYSYSTMEEFENTSKEICSSYDGIITSGFMPDFVLSNQSFAQNLVHSYFDFDIENTYRLILSELLLQPNLELSDIGIDLLYGTEETLDTAILNNRFHVLSKNLNQRVKRIDSYKSMEAFELLIAEYYLKLLELGNIKFVLTSSLFVSEFLTHKGYSCKYIFPSFNTIQQVVKDVCHQVDIRNMEGHLPALIRIDLHTSKEDLNTYALVQENIELKKNLTDFIQLEGNKLTLHCNTNNFEIYSNQNTLCELTQNYSVCCISKYIAPSLANKISIGYGLGMTFYDAHVHAVTASDYAYHSTSTEKTCFLVDENAQLISIAKTDTPSASKKLGISDNVLNKLSLESKLSINTLIKIINVLKTEKSCEISSLELISHLGISLRTANHYLSNLEKSGKASIIGQKRPTGKGRSINIYRLNLF